jgi:hypothetical protein
MYAVNVTCTLILRLVVNFHRRTGPDIQAFEGILKQVAFVLQTGEVLRLEKIFTVAKLEFSQDGTFLRLGQVRLLTFET